jgi:hypothetical protein
MKELLAILFAVAWFCLLMWGAWSTMRGTS